jgi:hypothetical protein
LVRAGIGEFYVVELTVVGAVIVSFVTADSAIVTFVGFVIVEIKVAHGSGSWARQAPVREISDAAARGVRGMGER